VSSQLERIKSSLQNMGGGPQAAGMERLKRQTSELTEGIKGLGAGFSSVADAGISLSRAAGLAGASVAAFGVLISREVRALGQYVNNMQQWGRLATQTGINAAQLQSMSQAMERSGISAERAQSNLAGLAHAMADIGRANSELRQQLLRGLQGDDRAAMEALLGDLGRVANDPAAFANRVRQAMDDVYRNVFERTGSAERAAEARRRFGEEFGMPDLAEFRGAFAEVSATQRRIMDERKRAADEYHAATTRIWQAWDRVNSAVQANVLPVVVPQLERIAGGFERTAATIHGGRQCR
jgi:hypothetical protein